MDQKDDGQPLYLYPILEQQDSHDPLIWKKVWNRELKSEQLRNNVEANASYFGSFIINELIAIAQNQTLAYNITTVAERDNALKTNLWNFLLKANIPKNIVISIDGVKIKPSLAPVLPNSNSSYIADNDVYDQQIERKLSELFTAYETKKGDNDFEIIALSLGEQIDALSQYNASNIAQAELIAWQNTLKALLKNAEGKAKETEQVQTYIEKTQAIIRLLNQTFETVELQQSALQLAVMDFNQTIGPLSEKDAAFQKGLKFSTAAIVAVVAAAIVAGFIAANPATLLLLPVLLIAAALPTILGYWAAEKYANHEIQQANSPGLVAKALGQLGIFSYTPYKHTAREFSSKVTEDPKHPSTPSQGSSVSPVTPTSLLPVYQ